MNRDITKALMFSRKMSKSYPGAFDGLVPGEVVGSNTSPEGVVPDTLYLVEDFRFSFVPPLELVTRARNPLY